MGGDLKIAAGMVRQGNSLAVVRDGRTLLSSRMSGVVSLLAALDHQILTASSLADKVVGRAAAMIAVEGGVTSIFTPVMSQGAVEVLNEAGIIYCAQQVVPELLNREQQGRCPIELITEFTVVPEKGVHAIRQLLSGQIEAFQVH